MPAAERSNTRSSRPFMPTGPKGQRRPADVIDNAIKVADRHRRGRDPSLATATPWSVALRTERQFG
jgi:hypothetical protein